MLSGSHSQLKGISSANRPKNTEEKQLRGSLRDQARAVRTALFAASTLVAGNDFRCNRLADHDRLFSGDGEDENDGEAGRGCSFWSRSLAPARRPDRSTRIELIASGARRQLFPAILYKSPVFVKGIKWLGS